MGKLGRIVSSIFGPEVSSLHSISTMPCPAWIPLGVLARIYVRFRRGRVLLQTTRSDLISLCLQLRLSNHLVYSPLHQVLPRISSTLWYGPLACTH